MSNVPIFAGLDYHPNSIRVCVLDREGRLLGQTTCFNNAGQVDGFVRRFGGRVRAAVEVSPGAADLADELTARFAWSVDLAHPGYVARLKQTPDKTDTTDARLLADLVRVGYLPRVWLAPQEVRELRRLVRYRQQLVHDRRNAKLRIRAVLRDHRLRGPGRAWTKGWLAWLRYEAGLPPESRWVIERQLMGIERWDEELGVVETRLESLTEQDAVVQKLRSLEGVGLVTAVTLRAEIGRFDRFRSGKQLARFCGLSPRNASSGAREADAGLVRASNAELRRVLIETAHRLRNRSAEWMTFGARLRSAGKPSCVIAAAIANRWTRRLYHEMKSAA